MFLITRFGEETLWHFESAPFKSTTRLRRECAKPLKKIDAAWSFEKIRDNICFANSLPQTVPAWAPPFPQVRFCVVKILKCENFYGRKSSKCTLDLWYVFCILYAFRILHMFVLFKVTYMTCLTTADFGRSQILALIKRVNPKRSAFSVLCFFSFWSCLG